MQRSLVNEAPGRLAAANVRGGSAGRTGGWWRRRIIAVSLGAAGLMAGCSVALKITYNQGPTLAYWWLDGYVDFDDRQSTRVKQLIDQWFGWNRHDELPAYVQLLQAAEAEVAKPSLTPQAFCTTAQEVKQKVLVAYEKAVPSLAELALTLTPEQIKHIEKRYAKNNDKFRDEFLASGRDERIAAQVKKARERFELVYGSLEDAQRERLRQLVAASPYDPELWLSERKTLQQELLQALRQLRAAHADTAALMGQAQAALRAAGQHTAQSPREAYRAQQQRVWDYNCTLAAQMHNTMSPAQRQHAQRKLQRWEDDLQALHAAPR